ncbi:MAG TPA: M64 family metallopeptidase [Mycobacteriales bacterium]|nr:M64 family metallopeptidase [Mycobacteriales bacterium]
MRSSRLTLFGLAVTPLVLAVVAPPAARAAQRAPGGGQGLTGRYEVFSPDGTITRRLGTTTDAAPPTSRPTAAPAVWTILNSGRADNRLNLVFLGDGYTAAQLGTYGQNVSSLLNNSILAVAPFNTYRTYLNAYRVDIASPVSGISNDPTNGITRVTPLGMHFWCHGLDRLLCVNLTNAAAYAAYAPGHDEVIALANTTTYGGSGGPATAVAGRNPSAGSIVTHESGHTLGQLADEYDVPYGRAVGVEPVESNVTAYTAAQMAQAKMKWYRWLGTATPDGGTINTYEGANFFRFGFYRPSSDSLMRSLGRPFNSVGREAMVEAIYRKVRPIDYATAVGSTQTRTSNVVVVPMRPTDHTLAVTWKLDGRIITAANNKTTLSLSTVAMAAGRHTLTATVVDQTGLVRDETFRSQHMTQTVSWPVNA